MADGIRPRRNTRSIANANGLQQSAVDTAQQEENALSPHPHIQNHSSLANSFLRASCVMIEPNEKVEGAHVMLTMKTGQIEVSNMKKVVMIARYFDVGHGIPVSNAVDGGFEVRVSVLQSRDPGLQRKLHPDPEIMDFLFDTIAEATSFVKQLKQLKS